MEGRFTRWQSITIAQLGYAINLILSFCVASLSFALSLAKNTPQLASNCWAKHLLLFSIVLILLSMGAPVSGASSTDLAILGKRKALRETTSGASYRHATP